MHEVEEKILRGGAGGGGGGVRGNIVNTGGFVFFY